MTWRGIKTPWHFAGRLSTHPGQSSRYTEHCGYCPDVLERFSENECLTVIVTFQGQSQYQFFMFVLYMYHDYI